MAQVASDGGGFRGDSDDDDDDDGFFDDDDDGSGSGSGSYSSGSGSYDSGSRSRSDNDDDNNDNDDGSYNNSYADSQGEEEQLVGDNRPRAKSFQKYLIPDKNDVDNDNDEGSYYSDEGSRRSGGSYSSGSSYSNDEGDRGGNSSHDDRVDDDDEDDIRKQSADEGFGSFDDDNDDGFVDGGGSAADDASSDDMDADDFAHSNNNSNYEESEQPAAVVVSSKDFSKNTSGFPAFGDDTDDTDDTGDFGFGDKKNGKPFGEESAPPQKASERDVSESESGAGYDDAAFFSNHDDDDDDYDRGEAAESNAFFGHEDDEPASSSKSKQPRPTQLSDAEDDDDSSQRQSVDEDRSRYSNDEDRSRYSDEDRSRYSNDEDRSRYSNDEDRSRYSNDEDRSRYSNEERSRSVDDRSRYSDEDRSKSSPRSSQSHHQSNQHLERQSPAAANASSPSSAGAPSSTSDDVDYLSAALRTSPSSSDDYLSNSDVDENASHGRSRRTRPTRPPPSSLPIAPPPPPPPPPPPSADDLSYASSGRQEDERSRTSSSSSSHADRSHDDDRSGCSFSGSDRDDDGSFNHNNNNEEPPPSNTGSSTSRAAPASVSGSEGGGGGSSYSSDSRNSNNDDDESDEISGPLPPPPPRPKQSNADGFGQQSGDDQHAGGDAFIGSAGPEDTAGFGNTSNDAFGGGEGAFGGEPADADADADPVPAADSGFGNDAFGGGGFEDASQKEAAQTDFGFGGGGGGGASIAGSTASSKVSKKSKATSKASSGFGEQPTSGGDFGASDGFGSAPSAAESNTGATADGFGSSTGFDDGGGFDRDSSGFGNAFGDADNGKAGANETPSVSESHSALSKSSKRSGLSSTNSNTSKSAAAASITTGKSSSSKSSGSKNSKTVVTKKPAERAPAPPPPSSKPVKREYQGYTREQMTKLAQDTLAPDEESVGEDSKSSVKRRRRRKVKKTGPLIDFAVKVNATVNKLGIEPKPDGEEDSDCRKLILGFETLIGMLLQHSDELELQSTFARKKDAGGVDAFTNLLDYAPALDETYALLTPVLEHYAEKEADEEMSDLLYGMNLMTELLCETAHRVALKQAWNARACTSWATLLELLARDTLEVTSIFDDLDTPEFEVSGDLEDAWVLTGHDEEFATLQSATDLAVFRQICYEVILSTDQWCPDTDTLMDICGIDETMLEEGSIKPGPGDAMSMAPETAVQVLEKITGDPLPRKVTLAQILRRIIPGQHISDPELQDNFVNIRSDIRNPLGIPTSNLVAISSVPEDSSDPESLGVAGVGKTTLAAMIANHEDVRRHFSDGIAWVHLGQNELNYTRYVQCMRDLVAQLEVEEGQEPLFPELLHAPGESASARRRREEGFMVFVRETMIDFLHDRNVLVVLDDVCFEPDLDWFDFGSPPANGANEEPTSCVVLLTTRRRNLLPAADTVEVDMLEEAEAVELLIRESGKLSDNLITESRETKAVVRECALHPLAVKSVGRWLNLKHATAGAESSVEEIHGDVMKSMERILDSGTEEDADMMYEILNMSLSPAINEEPTAIIKFCFAAFVRVFCDRDYISDFAMSDSSPVVPQGTVQLLFEALLDLEEDTLLEEGSLFYAQKKDACVLIPEALTALGVLKVILTVSDAPEDDNGNSEPVEEKYLQVTHHVQQEYGEYLLEEDSSLRDLTEGAERNWNRTFAEAYLAKNVEWDSETADAELDYALEMMPAHMVRGGLYTDAANLLSDESFVDGRLLALGRENGSRRHIKDCEMLYDALVKQKSSGRRKMDPKAVIKQAYQTLGGLLNMDEDDLIAEEGSPEAVEVGRCHFEIGFSLAEKRCWDAAIAHWETSQELLVNALGMVEVVAGILFNIGVIYADMNEYEQALGSLKQCLRIRGAIHGEEHILYAQTIQKIGDIFLGMSDYHEAMESYNWALDVMHAEPSHHRIDIGDILENLGCIHYSKGQVEESLQCHQDALRSKQVDLGADHPELSSIYQHIGNCLSDQSKTEEAVTHFEEAIRLKELDPDGGDEGQSDVLTIKGVLNNLKGRQKEGLECYEKALQILVTKVPHRKEKVASLLHLIGCVYLMSGEHKKAMKLFEESLQARRKVLGFVHLDVASTLFNMAFLHQTRNRLDKALKCLEEALKIRQLRLPDSEKVAVTHEKIGTLARSIGKTKKAEIAFAEALRIRKLIHGDSHEAVATVLQEMGDLMDGLGEYDDAMKKYGEALGIRHNRLGPDDLAVAETLYSMGFTLQNNGAAEKALECFDEALSIQKFQLGGDAKECGDTLNMMGFVQAKRGEPDEALSLLWDALRIRKLQEDNIKISETLKNIGNVHREKEEYELAIECYEECLKIRKSELGEEHEKVADAYVAIGNVQSDMEKRRSAMSSYQEALQIRRRLFGHQDESVAAVLQYMGTLEFHAKRLDRALQLLNDFINIREGLNTERDGDYVNVLFMIGNIHKMEGNEEQAQSCWTEAYQVFKELGLEDVNPEIAKVMGNMMGNDTTSITNNRESNDNHNNNHTHDQVDMFQEEPSSRSPSKKGKGFLGKLKRKVKGKKGSGGGGGGHGLSGGASVSEGGSVMDGGGAASGDNNGSLTAVGESKKRLGSFGRKRNKEKGHQL